MNEEKGQLTLIQSRIKEIVVSPIENNEGYEEAGVILANIKTIEKVLKSDKEAITKPMNAALKAVRKKYKPAETDLEARKRALQAEMTKYMDSVRKREEEASAQAAEAFLNDEPIDNIVPTEITPVNVAGVRNYTVKEVHIAWTELKPGYMEELCNRESVREALEKEIRKDALGSAVDNIYPRVEKGVTVEERKEIR